MRAGTPAVKSGTGAVKHTQHMFVLKDNTSFRGILPFNVLENALRVDCLKTVTLDPIDLGRRFKRARRGYIRT